MTKKWNECLRLILLTSLAAQVLMAGIIGVQSVDTYSPTSYSLLGMTSRVSGALADVQIDDGNSMVFRSYDGGTATVEYADNNVSDVDLSHSKGFQSNFSAQQNGPDSVCDVLTEENTGGGFPPNYELDLEVQWRNVNFGEQDEELAICLDRGVNSRSLDATGGYVIIGDGTPDWGSVEGTISFWVKMDNFIQGRCWGQDGNMETRWSGTNLVLDWGYASSLISATSFTANIWYFVAIVWDENNDTLFLYVGTETNAPTIDANSLDGTWTATTPSPTENRFLNGLGADQPLDGHGDELRYWDIAWSPAEIQSDYNSELNGSEPNLRSYFQFDNNLDDFGPDGNDASTIGACLFSSDVPFSPSPSENLQVDVWGGDSWHSLFANLVEGWNNVSIAPFLNSSTLTIRFKGGSDSGDTRQDSWKIDVALIRTRSKEQTIEVELTGVSNQEGWSQLTWTVVCSWTTSSVNVVLQLYNYTLGGYATHGSGFAHYLSSTSQGEEETAQQTVTANPEDLKNAAGNWRVRIKGKKSTDSPFESKLDLMKYEPTILGISSASSWPVEWIVAVLCIVAIGTLFPLVLRLQSRKKQNKSASPALTFDEQFGATRHEVTGKKTLLEVDPTLGYHNALVDFASETVAAEQSAVIFTGRNSVLHTAFSGKEVGFFLLTPNISSSKMISEKEVLIPMNDLSILLDTFDKAQKKVKGKPVTMLFDNLSDLILMCGFEKTYRFLRFLLETLPSANVTALFVFNPTAHDTMTSSSIRGLFHFRLTDLRVRQNQDFPE